MSSDWSDRPPTRPVGMYDARVRIATAGCDDGKSETPRRERNRARAYVIYALARVQNETPQFV